MLLIAEVVEAGAGDADREEVGDGKRDKVEVGKEAGAGGSLSCLSSPENCVFL